MRRLGCRCTLIVLCAGLSAADAISVNGRQLDGVYIRETASLYYVQVPEDGSVYSVAKAEVPEGSVSVLTDSVARAALLDEWKAKSVARSEPARSEPKSLPSNSAIPTKGSTDHISSGTEVRRGGGDGTGMRLRNVPLGDALKVTLRREGLDYSVENGYLYVSRPKKLRDVPYRRVQSRTYGGISAGADTLPKIVVNNPGGGYQSGGYGGMGGGYGGGYRGGMGGYGGGVQFSNISELFGTIDDRLVGEPPAVIGIGGLP